MASVSRRVLLALLSLLLLALRHAALSAPGATFPGDKAALAALRSAVAASSVPPHSCLSSWDFSRDPCAAFPCGVSCYAPPAANSSYLRVTAVALDPAGYSGALPAALLSSLPFLASLSLADNRFHGALPAGVPLPPTLRILDLSGNAFSGAIPASLFTASSALQELYLSRNALSGGIPPQLALLGALTRLDLQHNALTGTLPSLGAMRSLVHLDVSGNVLSGSPLRVPGTLPPSLWSVAARNNSFSGPLSAAALAALPALRVLDLTGNAVSGAVPGAAFAHPALQQLRLGSNQLDAVQEAPDGGSSSQLVELDLSGNRLAGRLPACLGAMPRLAAVALDRNRFTGGIPERYAVRAAAEESTEQWVPFVRLMLQGNYLCGALPRQLRQIQEGSAVVSLADNCLPRCPHKFFFCQGAPQKDHATCPKCDTSIRRQDILLRMP
ncbi:receptor-like protein kinase precursor [Zea mays]|uniref:Leucine-rich repeat (LRR) family protein n=1 Tax=Zea mays TaxID=4577 RepID=C4J489_MAIZE|nr:receptor-like protein kinase precursor [Zea mays]ACR35989.1 unknown [Zea mays]AQK54008.1 Leucine-rich repeat (LRR) family protein [Zea mays]|eukprot:NP_001150051.2 receptor-like protein kinase precursor [Zea mays]